MGLFSNQFANVVEWQEYSEDVLFWKWTNQEIKKGSRLIIRPGQDAIFLFNGRVEGIFTDEGDYDIESQIIPFLSTLKGFKFGFNSGMRAEVLFANTKEVNVRWGTKNPVNIPAPGLPGGMPIRAFGTFYCKIDDYNVLIEKIAGIKQRFTVEDVRERVVAMADQLLMKWISREGKDMFNLQANSFDIGKGLQEDLDMEMRKIGIAVTNFNISSFSYPESVKAMQEKAAAQSMVGDMGKYTQMAVADGISKGGSAGDVAGSVLGMQMGMMMGSQMGQMAAQAVQPPRQQNQQTAPAASGPAPGGAAPKFCPECGSKTEGAKFCSNCGTRLIP